MKKVILITGASSGIGKDSALELLRQGHIVYGAARRLDKMTELIESGGVAIQMDITKPLEVKDGVDRIVEEEGRLDVLINNAGFGVFGFVENTPLNEVKAMFDVNYWGTLNCIRTVLPIMRKQRNGRVINVSSVIGRCSMAVFGFYASTKYAIEAMSDALRQEVKGFGIDIVVVEPGPFKTGFDEVAMNSIHSLEESNAYAAKMIKFKDYFTNLYKRAKGPEKVIATIVKGVNSKKPKTRYKVGFEAVSGPIIKNGLPDRIFDKLVLKQLKIH